MANSYIARQWNTVGDEKIVIKNLTSQFAILSAVFFPSDDGGIAECGTREKNYRTPCTSESYNLIFDSRNSSMSNVSR